MAQKENVESLQRQQPDAPGEEAPAEGLPAGDPALAETPDEALRISEANNLVKRHVIGSMAISLVPIPLVDLVGLTGIQLRMLHELARLYRVPFSENLGKSLIVSLVGGFMPTSSAITLASFVKAVPGLGTATGMVSVTILGGATTYAIGSVFIQHFESGGTLLDFEPRKMRSYFAEKLQEGKQVASRLRKKTDRSEQP
ncbi:MAG: DUF697 domain-containing protein [Candidatus Competibacterales bacterium]|nr:DUF697 domain-containing protein [Candidatus Competibacterales bacterium]